MMRMYRRFVVNCFELFIILKILILTVGKDLEEVYKGVYMRPCIWA